MRTIILLSLMCAAYAVDFDKCVYQGANGGERIWCDPGWIGTGACGSYPLPDCVDPLGDPEVRFSTGLLCCEIKNAQPEQDCQWYAGIGNTNTCNSNTRAVHGICGSDFDNECAPGMGGGDEEPPVPNTIRCCESDAWVSPDNCEWYGGVSGEPLECPAGQVMTGHCSATDEQNCGFGPGNDFDHGIRCCDVIDREIP